MRKLYTILLITLIATGSAEAYTSCKGGVLTNNKAFCRSLDKLNWWSAANWCKANGGKLATRGTFGPYVGSFRNWCACGSCILEYYSSCDSSTPKTEKYFAICE